MHSVTARSLHAANSGSHSPLWMLGKPELRRDLGEADRVRALRGDALHLGDREVDVPDRDEAERDVHALRRLAPLLDHPVVVGLDAREPEFEVVALLERLAAEARERREGERAVHPVALEVGDAGVAVVAAGNHVFVGRRHHLHLRAVEDRLVLGAGDGLLGDRHELLLHVDDAVLVDPVVAPFAGGVDVVRVPSARHVDKRCELVALHTRALLAIPLGQPRLPDVGRLHHVVVDADDLRQLHSGQRIRHRFGTTAPGSR